jgi:hypothetical protein
MGMGNSAVCRNHVGEIMIAIEIINNAPQKPEMTASVESYKAAYALYQKEQKAYKASVLGKLKGQAEGVWLSLVQDFRGIPQTTGAIKVMVTSWTNSIRDAFAKAHPGRVIRPVKDGTQIIGYVVADVGNELTEKAVADVWEKVEKYPSLFVAGLTREDVVNLVEITEKNAATIDAYKARQARLAGELKVALQEIAGVTATVAALAAIGDKPGKNLAGQLTEYSGRVAAIEAAMAEPLAMVN